MAKKVKLLRDHGRNTSGEVVDWGFNSRLDNLQAAILNYKLKTYENDINRRREIAQMYDEGLRNIKSLYLPPPPRKIVNILMFIKIMNCVPKIGISFKII